MLNQIRNQTARLCLGAMMSSRSVITKPPNIIVQTECTAKFQKVASVLRELLERDRYTFHHLPSVKFLDSPWKDSCSLLLFECDDNLPLCGKVQSIIDSYLEKCGGNVIFYYTNNANFSRIEIVEKLLFKNWFSQNRLVVLEESMDVIKNKDLLFVLRAMGIKCRDENPSSKGSPESVLTDGYFISLDNKKVDHLFVLNDDHSVLGKDVTLSFVKDSCHKSTVDKEFVVFMDQYENEIHQNADFNLNLYRSKLKTSKYGQNIIATKIVNSTQTLLTGLRVNTIKCDGLVIHAKRQLKGKGRTGNEWLSPPGCMMFSMQIEIPLSSALGQSLSMIQHLVIVAFVKSVKQRGPEYNNLQLHIKWPNDIYINGQTKIGGIIVNSSLWENIFRVTIGLGVNMSNEKPTACLNSLIRSHNATAESIIPELEMEDVLAHSLNQIESLVSLYQEGGVKTFKEEYYKYWLHSDKVVALESYSMQKAKVVGIDDFGYLVVQLMQDGRQVTLQPDGNSFDMMKNLIFTKT